MKRYGLFTWNRFSLVSDRGTLVRYRTSIKGKISSQLRNWRIIQVPLIQKLFEFFSVDFKSVLHLRSLL
jgi:hypothetical protein